MTTTDRKVLHSVADAEMRAIRGYHADLICVEAPTGPVAQAVVGKPLRGETLTVNGDYICLIPLTGLAGTLKVYTTVTLDSMTATTAGPDEIAIASDPRTVNVADAVVLTSGTGDGALTSTVQQITTLTITGATYAKFTLSIAATPVSVVVTQCEAVSL